MNKWTKEECAARKTCMQYAGYVTDVRPNSDLSCAGPIAWIDEGPTLQKVAKVGQVGQVGHGTCRKNQRRAYRRSGLTGKPGCSFRGWVKAGCPGYRG